MRAHSRAVVITFLVVFLIAMAGGFALPRRFVASTDLWLDRDRGGKTGKTPDAPSARLARNTELRLLTSSDLAARTVAALGLERVRGLGQPRDGSLLDAADAQREAVRRVQERLSVEPVDDDHAVRIRFRADRPELAASVANRLADLYVDDRRGTSAGARVQQHLAARAAAARDAMVRSEAAVAGYRSAAFLLGRYEGNADPLQDLTLLNAELAAARASARTARAREEWASAAVAPTLRGLERRRAQRVIEDSANSETIERQIADQTGRLDRYTQQTRLADSRVRLVSRMRERSARLAARGRQVDAELARLTRVATEARERHAELAAITQATSVSAGRGSTAYVISRSSAESSHREPRGGVITMVSFLTAAVAAALVALALEFRHKGFRTVAALERALGKKVFAAVPELSQRRDVVPGEGRSFVPDYLVQAPESDFAQVFRVLLRGLQSGVKQPGPLVIAVSSALPDEGKTTVALCLTRSAALNGERTVLVDCDLRRPAASRALFPTLAAGLVEVIEGASLPDVLQRDPGSNAMFLGIGQNRHARTISLEPTFISPIIERLKQDYDLVICDMPPALALSEAREMAALADAVLLVVRQRQTPKGAVTIAQDLLTRAGAHIAGAALTMVRS